MEAVKENESEVERKTYETVSELELFSITLDDCDDNPIVDGLNLQQMNHDLELALRDKTIRELRQQETVRRYNITMLGKALFKKNQQIKKLRDKVEQRATEFYLCMEEDERKRLVQQKAEIFRLRLALADTVAENRDVKDRNASLLRQVDAIWTEE